MGVRVVDFASVSTIYLSREGTRERERERERERGDVWTQLTVVSLLAAALYRGNHDRSIKLRNIGSAEI